MWSYFIMGWDIKGNEYYVLIGVFSSYEEAETTVGCDLKWDRWFHEKYGNVQIEEYHGRALEIRPNLYETIYEYRDFGNGEEE